MGLLNDIRAISKGQKAARDAPKPEPTVRVVSVRGEPMLQASLESFEREGWSVESIVRGTLGRITITYRKPAGLMANDDTTPRPSSYSRAMCRASSTQAAIPTACHRRVQPQRSRDTAQRPRPR